MLKRSRGQYTPKMVQRCSQMGGAFGKVFHQQLCRSFDLRPESSAKKRASVYKKDIQALLAEFEPDALFAYIPGREHKGFKAFVHQPALDQEVKLGKKFAKLSHDLSFWRNRARHHIRLRADDAEA